MGATYDRVALLNIHRRSASRHRNVLLDAEIPISLRGMGQDGQMGRNDVVLGRFCVLALK